MYNEILTYLTLFQIPYKIENVSIAQHFKPTSQKKYIIFGGLENNFLKHRCVTMEGRSFNHPISGLLWQHVVTNWSISSSSLHINISKTGAITFILTPYFIPFLLNSSMCYQELPLNHSSSPWCHSCLTHKQSSGDTSIQSHLFSRFFPKCS